MLTKNFKNLMAMILCSSADSTGLLPVTAYNGTTYYACGYLAGFPGSVNYNVTTGTSSVGIHLGTGDTPPAADDYKLESQITSGLSASTVKQIALDDDGNPYLQYDLTVTNTGSAELTIREIGYMQNVYAATAQFGTSSSGRACLLDRTLLDEPVTIPARGYAVIRYTLKTVVGERD